MDNQAASPITMCLGKAAVVAGTTTTITNTGTTVFAIRGKAYSKTAMTNAATPTTDWATGSAFLPILASQGCVFMIGFDHSGNVKVIQGTVVPLDGIASSGLFAPNASQFGGTAPAGSDQTKNNDFCPVSYVVCANGTTGSSWLFGTNNWTATGMTATFVDVVGWPDRPQVS